MAAEEVYNKPTKDRIETDETPESQYPYNNVWQFPGGVRLVVGDERGKEAIKLFHPSGTYVEFFPDGKLATMTIGENKQYNKGGVTITVDENSDIHIGGHHKMTVAGGTHVEIQGDAGVVIGGKTAMAVLGDLGLSVNGNMYLAAKGSINMNAMGNMNIQAQGTMYHGSGSQHTIQATNLALNPSDGGSGYTA